jgi:hypothetical protein
MKYFNFFFSLILLFGFTNRVLSASKNLLNFVPEDAVFLLEIDDLNQFTEEIEAGPLGAFTRSKAWEKGREWIKKKSLNNQDSKKIEIFLEHAQEWGDSFNGKLIMAMGSLDKILTKKIPDMTLMVDTEFTNKELEEILKLVKKEVVASRGNFAWDREEIDGHKIHWIGSVKDKKRSQRMAVCILDQSLCFLLGGSEHIKETVMMNKNDSSDSMVENENYLDLFEEIDQGSARIFMNFNALDSVMKEVEDSPDFEMPENPFGMTTSKLIAGLALDSLDCIGIQIDPSDEKLVLASGAFFNRYEGIFSFFQHDNEEEVIPYDFIPSQAFTATSARYDMAMLWPTVEKIVKGLSPQLLLLMNSQIQAFEEQAGVAFRRDVLGSLGDEVMSFSLLSGKAKTIEDFEKANPSFYGISLTNSKLFDRSLRSMIDSLAPGNELFEDRVHKGVTVRKLRGLEESGVSLSYTVTDNWLFLAMGEDNQLNQMINRLQGKGRSLWQKKEIKRALKNLPDSVGQLDYLDLDQMVSFLVPIAVSALEAEEEIDLKVADFPKLPYFFLGWTKYVKRGLIGRAELFPISAK